ncbi:MAG: carbohydrate ABC transporter permease [Erysipelotrichaceae bacterium]
MYKKRTPYIYLLPWFIGITVFKVYPMILTFYYSFTEKSLIGDATWIGFKNYITLFTHDDKFWLSLSSTFKYVFFTVPLALIFGLFIAYILNFKLKGVKLFRTIYYIPSLLGTSVAVAILWQTLFSFDGPINSLVMSFGFEAIPWFTDPNTSLFILSLLRFWQFGSMMLIFLAALQGVPQELYEAATLDGSSQINTFLKVTIPVISPVILFNGIMALIGAFQEFNSPFIITEGGPQYHTYFLNMFIYQEAFTYHNFGYACALSMILVVIILFFTTIVFKFSAKHVFYSD